MARKDCRRQHDGAQVFIGGAFNRRGSLYDFRKCSISRSTRYQPLQGGDLRFRLSGCPTLKTERDRVVLTFLGTVWTSKCGDGKYLPNRAPHPSPSPPSSGGLQRSLPPPPPTPSLLLARQSLPSFSNHSILFILP